MSYEVDDILPGNPVREILVQAKEGSKLGLVIEGGAMRGVVTAGMVLALEQLGLEQRFTHLYGVSAGAVTAAYFASGQATWGTSMFYDELLREDFFSWKRAFRKEAPMNLDFLLEVMKEHKPLDIDKAAAKDLNIFASDVKSGELVRWQDFNDDLPYALRAASTVPLVAGGPASYRDGLYFDATVHTSVPWKQALEDGCTHLLVLLSRPEDSPRPVAGRIEKLLAGNLFAKRYPELVPSYLRRVESYNEDIQELRALEASGANILTVAPEKGLVPIDSFERKRDPLVEGARQGAEAMYKKLFGSAPHFYEMLVSSEKRGRPIWQK